MDEPDAARLYSAEITPTYDSGLAGFKEAVLQHVAGNFEGPPVIAGCGQAINLTRIIAQQEPVEM
jgi:hypothetical protein